MAPARLCLFLVTHSHKVLCLTAMSLIGFGVSLCYLMPRTLYKLDSSIIPVLEMRRLRFRNPTSAAKDYTPIEWKSWYSSPRLRTSKTVVFPPGYSALNPVIICYLQTPSITELKKHLELQQIGKVLLPSIVLVSPFPVSYPPSFLPPYGLFYMSSFL